MEINKYGVDQNISLWLIRQHRDACQFIRIKGLWKIILTGDSQAYQSYMVSVHKLCNPAIPNGRTLKRGKGRQHRLLNIIFMITNTLVMTQNNSQPDDLEHSR